ncbi:MAG: Rne/Rng family ribonuclease [Caulobacteraceae bacterium]
MTKRMLIDAAHAEETRVVVVDGTRIEELDLENQSRKQLRGNIYLAKVTRVEPSLQAAFIEYGGNRHGFLAFNEIHPDYYQIPIADREALMREAEDDHDDPEEPPREADDDEDDVDAELERRRRRLMRRYKIQEVIKRRQIMLVQVVKEERGNKGAALTTYLSLAGRYCVLMPNTARGGGISRKITNAPDRKRLKAAAQSLEVPAGMGVIIRTAGAARTKPEIKRDYEYLLRLWETIREATLKSIAPALIYEEEDLVKRAIRDMYDKDVDSIVVEGDEGYREARDFMRMIMPSQAKKVIQHKEPTPLFVKYKIEDQLVQIHSPVVPLRSGGYLVINQTEALVAVDVNSGRATRERNIEATALKSNMEAAEETARQLRLRDLAGLIVIDFIDMDEAKNNRAVEKKLKDCLADDRARVQMGKISPFGLMEISRQRRRMGVLEGATHVCEHCQGTGRIRSVESGALSALRIIEVEAARGGAGAMVVRLPTAVGLYVLNEKRAYLGRLEVVHDISITIAIDPALGQSEHAIERTDTRVIRERFEEPSAAAVSRNDLAQEPELEEEEIEDEAEEGLEEEESERESGEGEAQADGDRPRRRRRRRGGRRDEGFEARPARTEGSEDGAQAEVDGDDEDDDEPRPEGSAPETDAERQSRRRRRRGRRGGRRTREEGGTGQDPYVWREAHGGREPATSGDAVYNWRDPQGGGGPRPEAPAQAVAAIANSEATVKPEGRDGEGRGEGRRRRRGGRGRGERSGGKGAETYAWQDDPVAAEALANAEPQPEAVIAEAPAPEPVPEAAPEAAPGPAKPARRSRARKAAPVEEPVVEAVAEAVPEPVPEPVAEPEAKPVKAKAPRASRAKKPAAEPAVAAETAPEPVLQAVTPEPERVLEPALPDPAEISAPPAAPKRGWWRRGS